MMRKLWSKSAGPSFAFCGCLIIADAGLIAANPRQSSWVILLSVCVCVTLAIGIVGLICRFFAARSTERWRVVLGEDDLRKISKVSADSELTLAQKRLLLAPPYFKKLIKITGTVIDVDSRTGTSWQVTAHTSMPGLTVCMDFSDRHTFDYPLKALTPKQQLTVIGTISDIGQSGISLVNCEISTVDVLGAEVRPNFDRTPLRRARNARLTLQVIWFNLGCQPGLLRGRACLGML
jgi:hypothetical protein